MLASPNRSPDIRCGAAATITGQRGRVRVKGARQPTLAARAADDATIWHALTVKWYGNEERLIEVACSDPPEGRCRWTLQLLADRLVALGCVASVSREGVRQALKKTTSVPGW